MSGSQLILYYGISWRDFATRRKLSTPFLCYQSLIETSCEKVAALTVLLFDHGKVYLWRFRGNLLSDSIVVVLTFEDEVSDSSRRVPVKFVDTGRKF